MLRSIMGKNLVLPLYVQTVLREFMLEYPDAIHMTRFRAGTFYQLSDKGVIKLKSLASTYNFSIEVLPESVGITSSTTLMQVVQARGWYKDPNRFPGSKERDFWVEYIRDILHTGNKTCFGYETLISLLSRLEKMPDKEDIYGYTVKYFY